MGILMFASSAHASELDAGTRCELKERAKLFSAADGDAFITKLEAGTPVTLGDTEQGRYMVEVGESRGFLDADWLKKICDVQEPVSAAPTMPDAAPPVEAKAEAVTNNQLAPSAAPSTPPDAPEQSSSEEGAELKLDQSPVPETPTEPEVSTPAVATRSAEDTTSPATSAESAPTSPRLAAVIRPPFKLHQAFLGEARVKVVVLDTRVDSVPDALLDGSGMAAIISAELTNLVDGKADVVARSDMATLIARMEEAQLLGCSEPSCMTDIASLAEADLLISSKVTQAGEGFTLSLELLEAESGRALRRETVTWTGPTKGLVELCAPQVIKLVDAQRGQPFSGAIQLVATEEEAEVYVDEQLVGTTPLDIFPNIDIGKHTVRVSKTGFKLFEIPVVVNRNGTAVVQAELIRPWYNEWWVWTAAGAVLAGSVTAYVLANQGDDSTILEVNSSINGGGAR